MIESDRLLILLNIKSITEKSIHTLEGMLNGISIDDELSETEIENINAWLNENRKLSNRHPFNELIPKLESSIYGKNLSEEEKEDIIWVCKNLTGKNKFYNLVVSDIQRLHGILSGILLDDKITHQELDGLIEWLEQNKHLASTYPYDEIYAIVSGVIKDRKVTRQEENFLKLYFAQFSEIIPTVTADPQELDELKQQIKKVGICAIEPQIKFRGKMFCFTGESIIAYRDEMERQVTRLGGICKNFISKEIDYLVVGNEGNPCWAFSCYGRKIEKAMELRKKGTKIRIINENDFWKAARSL